MLGSQLGCPGGSRAEIRLRNIRWLARAFSAGMAAEYQTEREDEFPARRGCAIKPMSF
jgi:hypothetical protein